MAGEMRRVYIFRSIRVVLCFNIYRKWPEEGRVELQIQKPDAILTPVRRSTRCSKGSFSQSQLPVRTLLRCPCSPRVQSHASTSVRAFKIPNTGSHTIVRTCTRKHYTHWQEWVELLLRLLCLTRVRRPESFFRKGQRSSLPKRCTILFRCHLGVCPEVMTCSWQGVAKHITQDWPYRSVVNVLLYMKQIVFNTNTDAGLPESTIRQGIFLPVSF